MEKKYRLRKNKDFQYTYKKGRSSGHPLLVSLHRKPRNAEIRIGYTVTQKFGNAVQRNRIKRQLREILRLQLPRLKQGYDVIFIVRREAKGASYKSLEDAVNQLLKRSNLLK
ncbi:MAG: ribonuclease P protein component [Clostridiales bacterium]|nr:ribonuclease P protein component [Clostridiales bacterium]